MSYRKGTSCFLWLQSDFKVKVGYQVLLSSAVTEDYVLAQDWGGGQPEKCLSSRDWPDTYSTVSERSLMRVVRWFYLWLQDWEKTSLRRETDTLADINRVRKRRLREVKLISSRKADLWAPVCSAPHHDCFWLNKREQIVLVFLSARHSFFLFLIALRFLLGLHLSPTRDHFDMIVNQDTCPPIPEARGIPGAITCPFCQVLPPRCSSEAHTHFQCCWHLIIPAAAVFLCLVLWSYELSHILPNTFFFFLIKFVRVRCL